MMDRQNTCRDLQEKLAFCADDHPQHPEFEQHLKECAQCSCFEKSVGELAQLARLDRFDPPANLVKRTMKRLAPELAERTREGFWLRVRLAIAGLVSLPIIVGINGSLIWIVYSSLEGWLSHPLAAAAAYILAASTLLGLSLAYGSLPLLAEWGVELRRECRDLVTTAASIPPGLEATAMGRSK